ncbi:hypothetical protein IPC94_29805 [Pseudomonas aeruginosa]|nr:hypothetical protein IPC94_29805 [Pseudomonas aeruginosa]RQC15083.1 hypothetical protein IPC379_29485 [Pseudomonas aeruginosa]RTX53423.1 hypothetical protein DZA20_25890 [Pseudomonas aeruginosa]
MAWYRDNENVQRTGDKSKEKYAKIWKPGQKPDFPGIYKCQVCTYEDVINRECSSLLPCSNCKPE